MNTTTRRKKVHFQSQLTELNIDIIHTYCFHINSLLAKVPWQPVRPVYMYFKFHKTVP